MVRFSITILCLTVLFATLVTFSITVEARTLQEDGAAVEASKNQDHVRVRRQIEGVIEMIGNMFQKGEDGSSPLTKMLNGFMGALGALGGKPKAE